MAKFNKSKLQQNTWFWNIEDFIKRIKTISNTTATYAVESDEDLNLIKYENLKWALAIENNFQGELNNFTKKDYKL